jgi:hypothetical protein
MEVVKGEEAGSQESGSSESGVSLVAGSPAPNMVRP